MPLTVEGIALNPDVGEALPETQILDISHFPQEGKLWCWAACVQMVLDYYTQTKAETGIQSLEQCDIVRKKLHQPEHECEPDPSKREDDCPFEDMSNTWRDCGIQQVKGSPNVLSMVGIKNEIAARRPIEVGIRWNAGGGHAVLIKGWADPEILVIDDPLRNSSFGDNDPLLDSPLSPHTDGSGRATHEDLKDALGHGKWVATWFKLDVNNQEENHADV
jgi:Papain-like cysteine protease AvrRpt2